MHIQILRKETEMLNFLKNIIESSAFELEIVSFASQDAWTISEGALSHSSGGFFNVVGIKNEQEEKLMLFQSQSALTGIAITLINDEPFVLTQARIEPGNVGIGQYGPTIQSTPANFFRTHGGKSAPHLAYFFGHSSDVVGFHSSYQLDLGELYYQKSKWLNYALIKDACPSEAYMPWISLHDLSAACKEDHLINTDFRSLLGVFDWDSLLIEKNDSLTKPSGIINYLMKQRTTVDVSNTFYPINKLKDWKIEDNGIYGKSNTQIDIGLYKVTCKYREVSEWVQPLVSAYGKGKVTLLKRRTGYEYEYLLTVKEEIGIPCLSLITVSNIEYPGQAIDITDEIKGKVTQSYMQSDEGGRFYKHVSKFQVIEVDENWPVNEGQFWVNRMELKKLIAMPNITSIQLRNICSVILEELNPRTFNQPVPVS